MNMLFAAMSIWLLPIEPAPLSMDVICTEARYPNCDELWREQATTPRSSEEGRHQTAARPYGVGEWECLRANGCQYKASRAWDFWNWGLPFTVIGLADQTGGQQNSATRDSSGDPAVDTIARTVLSKLTPVGTPERNSQVAAWRIAACLISIFEGLGANKIADLVKTGDVRVALRFASSGPLDSQIHRGVIIELSSGYRI